VKLAWPLSVFTSTTGRHSSPKVETSATICMPVSSTSTPTPPATSVSMVPFTVAVTPVNRHGCRDRVFGYRRHQIGGGGALRDALHVPVDQRQVDRLCDVAEQNVGHEPVGADRVTLPFRVSDPVGAGMRHVSNVATIWRGNPTLEHRRVALPPRGSRKSR